MGNTLAKINVEVKNLSREYELEGIKTTALKDANFTINDGEFVVVLGPSGSGKTTLLNIIGGLDRPSKGTVIVDGTDLEELDETALSKFRCEKIGFIFQTYNLISTLTALENIEFPMKLAGIDDDQEIEKKSNRLLKLIGLPHRADHLPYQMSCGEQQRVAIARALANDPAIILADEPTGNLDANNKKEIVKLLANLNLTRGTTIIIVTHDIHVASHTERMILLSDGRITKERQGLHSVKKKPLCPKCHGAIQTDTSVCPSCQEQIKPKEERKNGNSPNINPTNN